MTKYYGYKLTTNDIVSEERHDSYVVTLLSDKDTVVEFWYTHRDEIVLDLQLQAQDILDVQLVSFTFETEGPLELNRVEAN